MKLIKLLSGSFLLTFGSLCLLVAILLPFDKTETPEDKNSAIIGALMFGLPMTAGGSFLLWSVAETHRQTKRDRLQSSFYQILKENNGDITVMRLAMATKVSGDEAQQFLTEKAKEFNADFKVTENGSVVYKFDI
ncbi:hypothetical protein [Planktothricoides raciborskii]|uniref:Uncharacterized protein n=1 Tax=Planktothricoides raciborskii FACHB-1370 TaxID=2949576 RepID=A0ABR8EP61_9CYAN|nr:hypothetical protein [Planktothricoides raciborskii]MBD2547753.1 hypothetical protein [Planktothricoides raciborskii FACHB-1370]MBD2586177.1 hypothetical protein [Planktothricoides raciborskii FACHB-1261]